MTISGVVIVLSSDEEAAQNALETLSGDPLVELGARQSNRIPAVVEAENGQTGSQKWESLRSVPGIDEIHVAFVSCDEDDEGESLQ